MICSHTSPWLYHLMAPVDVSMRPGERIELPTSVDIRSSTDITHVGTVGQHHCCPVTVQAASLPQNGTLCITLTTNKSHAAILSDYFLFRTQHVYVMLDNGVRVYTC